MRQKIASNSCITETHCNDNEIELDQMVVNIFFTCLIIFLSVFLFLIWQLLCFHVQFVLVSLFFILTWFLLSFFLGIPLWLFIPGNLYIVSNFILCSVRTQYNGTYFRPDAYMSGCRTEFTQVCKKKKQGFESEWGFPGSGSDLRENPDPDPT